MRVERFNVIYNICDFKCIAHLKFKYFMKTFANLATCAHVVYAACVCDPIWDFPIGNVGLA